MSFQQRHCTRIQEETEVPHLSWLIDLMVDFVCKVVYILIDGHNFLFLCTVINE